MLKEKHTTRNILGLCLVLHWDTIWSVILQTPKVVTLPVPKMKHCRCVTRLKTSASRPKHFRLLSWRNLENDQWRMSIWKRRSGFVLSILRQLSTFYVQTVVPDRRCSQLSTAYSSLQQSGWLNVCELRGETHVMTESTVGQGSRCVCEKRRGEAAFYLSTLSGRAKIWSIGWVTDFTVKKTL